MSDWLARRRARQLRERLDEAEKKLAEFRRKDQQAEWIERRRRRRMDETNEESSARFWTLLGLDEFRHKWDLERATALDTASAERAKLVAIEWPYYIDAVLEQCHHVRLRDEELGPFDPSIPDDLYAYQLDLIVNSYGADWVARMRNDLADAWIDWDEWERKEYAMSHRHLLERKALLYRHYPAPSMPGFVEMENPGIPHEDWDAFREEVRQETQDAYDSALFALRVEQLEELGLTASDAEQRTAYEFEMKEHRGREWLKWILRDQPDLLEQLGLIDDESDDPRLDGPRD